MEIQLKKLVELQKVSLDIARIEARIRQLPGLIRQAEEQLGASKAKIEELQAQVQEAQKERRQLSGEMDQVQQRISNYKSQLNDSKQIKTNEQYRAMLKQIDGAEEESYRILERQYEIEELEKRVAAELKAKEAEHGQVQQKCLAEQAQLEEEGSQLEETRSELLSLKENVEGAIEAEVLAIFSRVAAGRGGLGVAEVRDGACQACHVRLRPQVVVEAKLNEQIIQCDNCRRILYWAGPPVVRKPVELEAADPELDD